MSNKNWVNQSAIIVLTAATMILFCAPPLSAQRRPSNPDFTQGGNRDRSHDWTLGPTGARGWIYAWKHTADARQILITKVAKGSPAEGVLEVDDVILGVEGKPFDDDARIQFARAVMRAEPDWEALPPETPPEVRRVLRRALEKDPARRYPLIVHVYGEPAAQTVVARSTSRRMGRSASNATSSTARQT